MLLYTFAMNLQQFKNSSVLLLGKSRAFSMDEFYKQMSAQKITCITEMGDEVQAIIEGGLMNPIEQDLLEELYFKKELPIFRIEKVEEALAQYIDESKLLMSLKLSGDRDRLHSFLKNPLIGDTLFLKLLKLYDFKNEGFFDTDENRDITTALIERFYDDLEANHNIQYISLGIIQLINRTQNCELINTLASLSIIKKAFKKRDDELSEVIVHSLASHPCLAKEHHAFFAKNATSEVGVILASREDLHPELEQSLLALKSDAVDTALAKNRALSMEAITLLKEQHEETIILHVNLDKALFDLFLASKPELLAQNPTLFPEMIEALWLLQEEAVVSALAKNQAISLELAERILAEGSKDAVQNVAQNSATPSSVLMQLYADEDLHVNLAHNTNLSQNYITRLSKSSDIDILTALAQNSATPLEVLYEFLLDMRLENLVRQNPALNDKYQR